MSNHQSSQPNQYPGSVAFLPKEEIERFLSELDREQLMNLLVGSLDIVDIGQKEELFGDLIRSRFFQEKQPTDILKAIRRFYDDCLEGKFYAPFELNAKTSEFIPPETEVWCSEIAWWLDKSCELLEQGHYDIGRQCLQLCMKIHDKMGDDDVVFAHELGDWMIVTKHEYHALYRSLSPQT